MSESPSPSASGAPRVTLPPQLKTVGVLLAVLSGVLIGSSFVFKKKGLLATQVEGKLGEGVGYLKSAMWWTGMVMMIIGEICNLAAYSFVEAIVVTPLGALSVVICAILSHFFLNESLTMFGIIGCALCIVGSVTIALNGPKEETVGQILEFQKLFLAPGFLGFGGALIIASLVIIIFFAPKYGDKNMLWYIVVCSLIGGLSVSCTTGLGAAIVTTALGDNQFKHWFIYFLLIFVTITLLTEIFYLNKALALFNTALVTPTYYVIFTTATLLTSIILFQGMKASATQIITLVMGFLTICLGITILQMSKVDPTTLTKLDRRSTMLLQASRSHTENQEKSVVGYEDPGIDSLRGGFGTIGSIIRARSVKKLSVSGGLPSANSFRHRHPYNPSGDSSTSTDQLAGVQRHQLWDAPVPSGPTGDDNSERISLNNRAPPRQTHRSIRFDTDEIRHYYPSPGAPGTPRSDSVRITAEGHAFGQAQQPHLFPPSSSLHAVHSAPPVQAGFERPKAADPFEDAPKTAVDGLLVDTTPDSSEEDFERRPLNDQQQVAGRRYPRGGPDQEESFRLVQGPTTGSGGVRLVQSQR